MLRTNPGLKRDTWGTHSLSEQLKCGISEVDFRVVDVVAGIHHDEFAVFLVEMAAHFGWNTGPESSRRNGDLLGNQGAGGDDTAFADARTVENARADADQDGVFNDASVDGGIMADGDPVAHMDRKEVALAVEDGAILHVGVGANADGVDITAQHGVHPDRGVCAEFYIADDLC